MRAAIYFVPPAEAPTTRLAAEWLGRDPYAGADVPETAAARDPLVAEPARYGFHATMKAPFRLAEGRRLDELDHALAAFCRDRAGAAIESLALRRIEKFFALVPDEPSPELDALAAAVVEAFERFRAPLTAEETARRRPERLSERQRAHLDAYGYPFVFDEFRFHMTLTGRVDDAEAESLEKELRRRFSPVLERPLAVDGLALFVEPSPGAPFRIHARHSLLPA